MPGRATLSVVLRFIADGVVRRPRVVVSVWAVLVLVCATLAFGLVGEGLFNRLHSGEPTVPGAESQQGRDLLSESEGSEDQVTLLVRGVSTVDPGQNAAVATLMGSARTDLAAIDGVIDLRDPYVTPEGAADPAVAPLVSDRADGFLVLVTLDTDRAEDQAAANHDAVVERLQRLADDIGGEIPGAHGIVSSTDLLVSSIVDQLKTDLYVGEAIALPISLLIMVIVFGGFLAAGMPVIGALASIAGGMGALLAFSHAIELDQVVVNVVSILGLGLSIDYGLLVVSRFREEARKLGEAGEETSAGRRRRSSRRVSIEAVHRAVLTAGRTVTFSAITIAIAVSSLMILSPDILRSLGAAGLSVVLIALASSVTLVPAMLVLLGDRLLKPSVTRRIPGVRTLVEHLGDVAPEEGVFSKLARLVHRLPWVFIVATMAVLAFLASPVLHMQLRNSDVDLLPSGSVQREFIATLAEEYPVTATPPISVVAEADESALATWSQQVEQIENVATVYPPQPANDGEYVVIGVDIDATDAGGETASQVVRDIRAVDVDLDTWVVGQAANQIDFTNAMRDGLPLAVGVVVVALFTLLFLMTGSVVIPLKALIVNVMGLSAGLGVTVWAFQDGHLGDLLGFSPVGGLESYLVAVVLAFGFGLAMDYEVFLLARIKDYRDAGCGNDEAVERGLQRSGRIITSAALIIAIVFLGFVAGDLIVIKQAGFALAVTVLIDATLVRMLLVPATMTILGEWNWWAPRPLRAVHRRFEIRES